MTKTLKEGLCVDMVPRAGLEPACLAAHAPETCVSTNFTTSAGRAKLIKLFNNFPNPCTYL